MFIGVGERWFTTFVFLDKKPDLIIPTEDVVSIKYPGLNNKAIMFAKVHDVLSTAHPLIPLW